MTRYRALRAIGCDPLAAGVIAFVNWLRAVPRHEIRFMHVTMEIDDEGRL